MITNNGKMVHSATGLTPDAKKSKNELNVKANIIAMHPTKTRKYPNSEASNKANVSNKKDKLDKERVSNWQDEVHKASRITTTSGQNLYHLDGQAGPCLRQATQSRIKS